MRPAANSSSSIYHALTPMSPLMRSPVQDDLQERDRRGLEQLIERGVDSLAAPPLSTTDDNDYSVEYPRHGGQYSPLPFDPYSSFARSQQHFDFAPPEDDDERRQQRFPPRFRQAQKDRLSYRDDDTYGAGETMSTANHHRSALTLGAGLRGRLPSESPRRPQHEYDPDRQVDRLLDHRGQMSMFDDTTPRKGNRKTQGGKSRQSGNKSAELHVQVSTTSPPLSLLPFDTRK